MSIYLPSVYLSIYLLFDQLMGIGDCTQGLVYSGQILYFCIKSNPDYQSWLSLATQ